MVGQRASGNDEVIVDVLDRDAEIPRAPLRNPGAEPDVGPDDAHGPCLSLLPMCGSC
jgi:hypothetical protein